MVLRDGRIDSSLGAASEEGNAAETGVYYERGVSAFFPCRDT